MKRALSVLILASLFLCGCKGKAPEGPEGGAGSVGDFTLAMETQVSLDPLKTKQESASLVYDLVYDSLVYVDRELRAVPYLAESCTVSEDGCTIYFALHQGIYWHDGASFTAADVEHTINRIRALGEDCIYYDRLRYIEGITVRDMYHFDLQLTKPHITVLNLLDFPIVPCHRSDLDTTMVGTGQYRLEAFTPQKNLTLVKNEGWALSEPPAMERIYVKMIERTADATSMVKIGEVTAVASHFRSVGGLGIGENMQITHYPTLEYEFIGFNMGRSALMSQNVRQAIAAALDRDKIIEDVFLKYGSAACVPVPPNAYMYIGAEGDFSKRDTEKAKGLLYADGYNLVDGKMQKGEEEAPLSLSLLINEENGERKKYAEIVKENLAEIGISVEISAVPFETYMTMLYEGDFELYAGGCEFSADLSYNFLLSATSAVSNGYDSPDMEAALLGLGPQRTDETIIAAYKQFQEVCIREMPIAGIAFLDGALVHTAALRGIETPAFSKLYRNIGKWYLE